MIEDIAQNIGRVLNQQHNQYLLTIDGLSDVISIFSVTGKEAIDRPWRYTIEFTSTDKAISKESVLTQSATFSFLPPSLSLQVMQQLKTISSLDKPAEPRHLYGVVTQFSQLSISKDEARYQVVIEPRLALLGYRHNNAIYQHQSVVSVVESILRSHGLTGVDFRLELADSYPTREYISQWQESDLDFILRLLADVGIRLTFESSSEHSCDVIVLSDNEKGYADGDSLDYTLPGGLVDLGQDSLWDLSFIAQTVEQSVAVKDYNYRDADNGLYSSQNSVANDSTTYGEDYRYGEHHKHNGDSIDGEVESGSWYAKIRHQQRISEQMIIQGKSNHYLLSPGQIVHINHSPLSGIDEGVIILSVAGTGNRSDSYEVTFTAIPYQVLKPYRPKVLPWPVINHTLPARVTSPDNDTYGYLDTQGRYRVKMNFDLANWKAGEESLWVRLARPYAGNTYGFHFPLIDGTEVAIAFSDGNPDRPYIAHAMHDSAHPDLVSTANKHRNVIRTPANNKLRMDDQRGQEHIKLATEYGKTQLNIGHLVDSNKERRGQGFELRTDEWGAIRAGKGLYITTEEQNGASGLQLQMENAVKELQQAQEMVKRLNEWAEVAKAELADIETQKSLLESALKDLASPALLQYAPAGMASVTPASIQQTAGENIIQTAQSSVDISAFKRFMVTAGNMISLFANKMGIKIFASKGNVDIQAQTEQMLLSSKQEMKITSTDSEVIISASKKLTLCCDGVAIVLEGGSIQLIAPGDIEAKAASFNVTSPTTYSAPIAELPEGAKCSETL